MRWALGGCIAFCIFLGSISPTCMAMNPPFVDHESGASNILTPQAAADLFKALDLTRPDLVPVAVAWKRNDKALAQTLLAQYFRKRMSVGWRAESAAIPHLSPASRAIADGAVNGRLQGGMVTLAYSFPNGKIDWHFNATDHTPNETHNDEWQWQLNRMSFWSDLAGAYRQTGDERYSEAFVQELHSWIEQCPVPDHAANLSGSPWRTIDAGIRAGGSWMDAFYAFRGSKSMSDADLLAMVHSILDHGRYLRSQHTRLNWLTMEMSGLYAIGAVFPEFTQAAEWRNYAASTLGEESRKQFLPDGAQMELSTGYQNVSLDSILGVAEIARWTGTAAELPVDYFAPLEKAYEWQVDIVAPDRYLPKINDSWPTYLPAILKKAVISFPNESDFQWFASDGRQGSVPPFTSVFLNRSGLAVMRSGWDADANYLLFRLGPLGMGHQHQDSLGVNVWAYGRELIFNSGGGSYENSKWRQWAISAFAHNTLVVDEMAQTRIMSQTDPFHDPNMVSQGPIDADWRTNSLFDFASAIYADGYGPEHKKIASQRRDVLFLKPNIYVVADRVNSNDSLPHRFQARWQILTTKSRIDPSTQALVTEDLGKPNISVVPLLVDNLTVNSVSGQEVPEILGWDFRKDTVPPLVPATTLLQTLSGSGPHLILTMFVPLRPGESNPITKVEPGADGVSATAIFADGRRLLIACPGPLGISAQETLPNGKVGRSVKRGIW
jgi:Heparinase II/III N-terminus/Heparinase II/III-like protein